MELGQAVASTLADAFDLGDVCDVALAARGWVSLNVTWRISTGRGVWAVKEVARESRAELEAAAEIESAAGALGVLQPGLVRSTTGSVTVSVAGRVFRCHEFIDGGSPAQDLRQDDAEAAGRALGLIHAAELTWDPVLMPTTVFGESHWLTLIDRGIGVAAPWVGAVRIALPGILRAEAAATKWRDRPHRWVGSHRDLRPENSLRVDGDLVLVDWDGAGPVVRGREVAGALRWWQPHGDAFLAAYNDAAGEVDLREGSGEDGGLVWWLETNVQHALALPGDEEREWAVSALAANFVDPA